MIEVTYHCCGCDAVATAKAEARREGVFRDLGPFDSGFARTVDPQIRDLTPDGWVAFDHFTLATYCPTCWSDIVDGPKCSDCGESVANTTDDPDATQCAACRQGVEDYCGVER